MSYRTRMQPYLRTPQRKGFRIHPYYDRLAIDHGIVVRNRFFIFIIILFPLNRQVGLIYNNTGDRKAQKIKIKVFF